MSNVPLLLMLCVLVTLVNAKCYSPQANVTFTGVDINTTKQASVDLCCQDCIATPSCNYYSWSNGHCYLKKSRGNTTAATGEFAGSISPAQCTAFLNDTDYAGYDIASTTQSEPNSCCADCEATPGCLFYVWNPNGTCHLKSGRGNPVALAGAKASRLLEAPSSLKCSIVEENVGVNGTQLGIAMNTSYTDCCAGCVQLDGCTHWQWISDNDGSCLYINGSVVKYQLNGGFSASINSTEMGLKATTPIPTYPTMPPVTTTPIPTYPTMPPLTQKPTPTYPTMPPITPPVTRPATSSLPPSTPSPPTATPTTIAPSTVPLTNSPAPSTTSPPVTSSPVPPTTPPLTPSPTNTPSTPSPTSKPTPSPPTTTPVPTSTTQPLTATPPPTTNAPTTTPPATSPSPTTLPPATSSVPTSPPTTSAPTTATPTTPSPTSAPTPAPSPTPPTCSSPRVRKSWAAMTEQSRSLYTNAIALALDKGHYQKFIGVYSANYRDAYGRTTSLLWRRYFLRAFEDMLRSLGTDYSCLTVPYWDYFTEFNGYFTRHCKNINDCSSLTRALGGVSTGFNGSTYSVFGYSRPDLRCVTEFPLNHFCATTTPCSNCLPRDDWRYKAYPPELSMPLMKHFLFSTKDYAGMALAIENQVNLKVHQVLGGMIANPLISPVDPLIWSHYATLDLLETIYYDCRVDAIDLSTASASSFQGTFNGVDMPLNLSVGMPWFEPTTYFNLTNPRSMGTASYSYEYSSTLQTLHERCDRSKSPSKLNVELATGLSSNATDTSATLKEADSLMNDWYELLHALGSRQGLNSTAIDNEVEKITLLTITSCLKSTIDDYSTQFRSDWQITETAYAKALLEDIKSGRKPIKLDHYELVNHYLFQC